ncbi:MAG: LPS export ABC transporter periplasmic protein LptC [Pseudomonadota bacterium]
MDAETGFMGEGGRGPVPVGPVPGSRDRAWALPGSPRDRVTKLVRVTLPIMAAAVLAAGLVWPLTQAREFSFILSKDRVAMAGDRMRLGEAVYRGEDAQGRPFAILADSGVQETSADPRVRLTGLRARLQLDDGAATVTAPSGIYELERERLLVAGPVRVARSNGYRLVTSDVTVDIPARRVKSDERVVGALPIGTFAADTMIADITARTVTLDGNARMRIDPR